MRNDTQVDFIAKETGFWGSIFRHRGVKTIDEALEVASEFRKPSEDLSEKRDLFVSYRVEKLDDDGTMRPIFGSTVVSTTDPKRVTLNDIYAAEKLIREHWKTVGATVLSFHRLDCE